MNTSYPLEKRTSDFGTAILRFCKTLKQDIITKPLISQIVRSATSVGANYMEANGASSKRDFINKIFICRKEVQETKHWLIMLAECYGDKKPEIRLLWKECQELTLIFSKITATARKNSKDLT